MSTNSKCDRHNGNHGFPCDCERRSNRLSDERQSSCDAEGVETSATESDESASEGTEDKRQDFSGDPLSSGTGLKVSNLIDPDIFIPPQKKCTKTVEEPGESMVESPADATCGGLFKPVFLRPQPFEPTVELLVKPRNLQNSYEICLHDDHVDQTQHYADFDQENIKPGDGLSLKRKQGYDDYEPVCSFQEKNELSPMQAPANSLCFSVTDFMENIAPTFSHNVYVALVAIEKVGSIHKVWVKDMGPEAPGIYLTCSDCNQDVGLTEFDPIVNEWVAHRIVCILLGNGGKPPYKKRCL